MHQQPGGSHRRQTDQYHGQDPRRRRPQQDNYRGRSDAYPQRQYSHDAYPYRRQPDDYYQQDYYQPNGYAPAPPPRKKRRVFMWAFFAVQALFLIWLIAGLATGNHTNAADVAKACNGHNWYPLFQSQADCATHYNVALNDAQNVGKGLGLAVIIIIWMVVDFFLGLGYGIYRLATRSR